VSVLAISWRFNNPAFILSVGDLRFQLPVPINEYTGIHNASTSGPSCPQLAPILTVPEGLSPHAAGYTSVIHAADFESEDCELIFENRSFDFLMRVAYQA
jgi:hypothetical protein